MVFTEPTFLFLFLPVLLWLYWLCPVKLRNLLLTLASLMFYAWGEKVYAAIMLLSIGMNYAAGLGIDKSSSATKRKLWLTLGIVGNLGLLCFFKYADFVVANLNPLLVGMGLTEQPVPQPRVHLPIGISFFTFQAMSYIIDVYRRETKVQRNVMDLGLYISLFPQLIAGPIVRYGTIADQIKQRTVNSAVFQAGLHRFIIGFAKKVVIANAVAYPADQIFALQSSELTTPLAWLGIVCYSLQIYFDFSGYSDMAIGLGRMFGFRFPENFNYPYVAKSMTDFWRRWHITLSTWFRDYLYIPLGGNRASAGRMYFNLITVFFLCGLWHGANWAFVVWGLFHGGFLVIERLGLGKLLKRMPVAVGRGYTLLAVMIGWVFFRAATGPPAPEAPLAYGLMYCARLFGFGAEASLRELSVYLTPQVVAAMVLGVVGATPIYPRLRLAAAHWVRRKPREQRRVWHPRVHAAGMVLRMAMLLYGILLIAADTYNPFIYFQF